MAKKGGRPAIVLNDEQVKEVEEIAGYLTLEQIGDYFKIAKSTFLEIRERQPEVFDLYKKGRAKKHLRYARALESKAMGESSAGDSACLMFYLKTQARWSEKDAIREDLNEPITMTLDILKTGEDQEVSKSD